MPASKFVWYELMTSDPAAAARFYSQVVGWAAADSGMALEKPYTLLRVGEIGVGGMMETPDEMKAIGKPPSWAGYVGVDDVDAMAARVLAAGGKVLRPADDIPQVGRFAVVADPQGAAFVLFTPLPFDAPPALPPGTPGTPAWHELSTLDQAAAWPFYEGLFGWAKGDAIDMGPVGIYQLFDIDGESAGGMMNRMNDDQPPAWGFYFHTADIGAAAERVKAAGGQVVHGPMQVPGGQWIINALDPQGALFGLVAPGTGRVTLRVGLVGYGYAGRTFHAPLVAAVPGLVLAAVASRDAAKVHADWPGMEVVADPLALVARDDLDLVVIATPNDSHHPLALAALRAGRHVCVDKPFTVTLAQARELALEARRLERVLSVFHNRRWDGDFLTLQRLQREGTLGRIVGLESRFDRFRPEVRARWRELDGPGSGVWFDLGPHLLDQALRLFGLPLGLTLERAALRDGAQADDWFRCSLRYERVRVMLHAGMLVAADTPRFVMLGSAGAFTKHGVDRQEDALRAGGRPAWPAAADWGVDDGAARLALRVGAGTEVDRAPVALERGDYVAYYAALADAIRGRGPNPVTPEEAIAVMALIELGVASAAHGRELTPEAAPA